MAKNKYSTWISTAQPEYWNHASGIKETAIPVKRNCII